MKPDRTAGKPHTGRYVAYYRVSTDSQGESGLGIEAQQAQVAAYQSGIVAAFTEVESGKRDDRPELAKALEQCRRTGATLLIAKIDRLSRDAAFLLTLRKSGVDILAADMPNAGTLEFGIRAVFAQHEREEISRRTRAALAAAKRRGIKLGSGNPRKGALAAGRALKAKAHAFGLSLAPVLTELQASGHSTLREIGHALTARGILTPRGGTAWHPSQVANLLRYAT